MSSRSRRCRPRGRARGDVYDRKVKISIRNIDPHTDEQDIEELFTKHGEMEDIYVPRDEKMVCNRGYAFVTFMNARDAKAALEEDCAMVRGQRVAVAFAHRRPGNMRPPRSYVPSRDGPGGLLREWVAKLLRKRSSRRHGHRLRSPYKRSRSAHRRSRSYRRSRSPRRSHRSRSRSLDELSKGQRDGRRRSYSGSRGRKHDDRGTRSRRRSRHRSIAKQERRRSRSRSRSGNERLRSLSRTQVKNEQRSIEKQERRRSRSRSRSGNERLRSLSRTQVKNEQRS